MNSQSYSTPYVSPYTPTPSYTSTSGSSLYDTLSSISVFTWIIIFIVLAFFGFNVFVYLAKGTQGLIDIFGPYVSYILNLFGNTAIDASKQAINVSAEGTKGAVDVVSGATTTGLNVVQQVALQPTSNPVGETLSSTIPQVNVAQNTPLSNALNQPSAPISQNIPSAYQADDSTSIIQSSKTSGKSGWCYIGEDRGFRSCIEVGANDTCMSGDVFPSQDICVNPSLRP
jgi:hypothetical protein